MYWDIQEPVDSPGSSMDRNMEEMTDLIFSQSSPDRELPTPQHMQYAGDAALLARFSAMLQQEFSKACCRITADLKRDIQGIGE